MTSVSIAIASYNGERYLSELLASLGAQTLSPAEVVVSDDCSTDKTVEVVQDFAERVTFPVRLYRNKIRLGYIQNFIKAASLCRSELISLCDQDDIWNEQKIELVIRPFSDASIMLSYHDAFIISADRTPIGELGYAAHARRGTSPWYYSLGFTQTFRSSLVRYSNLLTKSIDHFNVERTMAHDQWFFFLAEAVGQIAFIPEKLVCYRQHGGNVHGCKRPATPMHWISLLLRDRADEYRRCMLAAERRKLILEELARSVDPSQRGQVSVQCARYARLERAYSERVAVWADPRMVRRATALHRLAAQGAYTRQDAFGRKSLLSDMILGVVLRPFIGSAIR